MFEIRARYLLQTVTGVDLVFQKMDTRKKVYEIYALILLNSGKLELITEGEKQIMTLEKV